MKLKGIVRGGGAVAWSGKEDVGAVNREVEVAVNRGWGTPAAASGSTVAAGPAKIGPLGWTTVNEAETMRLGSVCCARMALVTTAPEKWAEPPRTTSTWLVGKSDRGYAMLAALDEMGRSNAERKRQAGAQKAGEDRTTANRVRDLTRSEAEMRVMVCILMSVGGGRAKSE